jgi:hypothetical protein
MISASFVTGKTRNEAYMLTWFRETAPICLKLTLIVSMASALLLICLAVVGRASSDPALGHSPIMVCAAALLISVYWSASARMVTASGGRPRQ